MSDYKYYDVFDNPETTKEQALVNLLKLFRTHKQDLPYGFANSFEIRMQDVLTKFNIQWEYHSE